MAAPPPDNPRDGAPDNPRNGAPDDTRDEAPHGTRDEAPHGTDGSDKRLADGIAKRLAAAIDGVNASINLILSMGRPADRELTLQFMRLDVFEWAQHTIQNCSPDEAVAQIRKVAIDSKGQAMIDLLGVLND